jgi:MYXO-CTERM domain-containing protein
LPKSRDLAGLVRDFLDASASLADAMRSSRSRSVAVSLGTLLLLAALPASAFPGFFVGKTEAKRIYHQSSYLVMNRGDQSVVSVISDYQGPFEPFAVVLAVPSDVTLERVSSIRREFVDRVDQMSAPRYHEFWESDPCDPTTVTQEWERDLRVQTGGDNFLGSSMDLGPTRKVPKELLLSVKTEQKSGEYTFFMPKEEQTFEDLLKERGWVLTGPMQQAITAYAGQGNKFVLAEVDPNRVELIGSEKGQLSPIRFWSDQRYSKLPEKLGRLAADGAQELFVFVLDTEHRYTTKNYEIANAPTNIEVDYQYPYNGKDIYLKERMAELFAGLHDRWLAQHPKTFWLEYVWKSEDCGQPCPNDPLLINELLTLGGEVFENKVPDEERSPKPTKRTEEEEQKVKLELDGLPVADRPKRKKMLEEERKELFKRKALLARHQYIITRMHHRFSDDGLPNDVEIGAGDGGLEGGIGVPKGKDREVSREVKPAQDFKYQSRFINFHPWMGMQACESPERYRWGKPPRTYRGLRKIWVVEDLFRKSRTEVKVEEVVETPIPDLNLTHKQRVDPDAGTDAGVDAAKKGKGCGCRVAGADGKKTGLSAILAMAAAALLVGRRRR